jgi:hypothetical protein
MCQGEILTDFLAIAKRITGKDVNLSEMMKTYIGILIMEKALTNTTNAIARSEGRRLNVVSRARLFDTVRKNPDAFAKYFATEAGQEKFYETLKAIILDSKVDLSDMSEKDIVQFVLDHMPKNQ